MEVLPNSYTFSGSKFYFLEVRILKHWSKVEPYNHHRDLKETRSVSCEDGDSQSVLVGMIIGGEWDPLS